MSRSVGKSPYYIVKMRRLFQVQQGAHRHQPPRGLQRGHGEGRGAAALVRDGAGKEMLSNIFLGFIYLFTGIRSQRSINVPV